MTAVMKKKVDGQIGKIKVVVLIVGGNDFGERASGGGAEVVMTLLELKDHMERLVRWMLDALPGVKVRTFDLIPRQSLNASFICGARNWSSGVKCVEKGRHEHVLCWRVFAMEPRRGERKRLKKLKTEGVELEERERFELREELYAEDGVHLSFQGKRMLAELLKWQLEECPRRAIEVDIRRNREDGEPKTLKLRANFNF